MLRLEDAEDAIIGYVVHGSGQKSVAYNFHRLIHTYAEGYFPESENPHREAAKWIEFMVQAYQGPNQPILVYPADEDILQLIEMNEVRH